MKKSTFSLVIILFMIALLIMTGCPTPEPPITPDSDPTQAPNNGGNPTDPPNNSQNTETPTPIITDGSTPTPAPTQSNLGASFISEYNQDVSIIYDNYFAVEMADDYLYAVGESGLSVYEASTPDESSFETHAKLESLTDITIQGNYAFISFNDVSASGFHVFNILTKSNPVNVATIDSVTGYGSFEGITKIKSNSNYIFLYSSATAEIIVLNTSNPTSPSYANTITFDLDANQNGVIDSGEENNAIPDFAVSGNYGIMSMNIRILGNPDYVVRAFDLTNINSIQFVDIFTTPGEDKMPSGVAINNNLVFISFGGGPGRGVEIYNLSTFSTPTLEGSIADAPVTFGETNSIKISGSFAYISNVLPGGTITKVDISTPASPSISNTYTVTGNIIDLAVNSDFLYVAEPIGIELVNMTADEVTNPSKKGHAHDVFFYNNNAFIAYGEGGVKIVNVTNPNTPTLTKTVLEGSANVTELGVYTDKLYYPIQNDGLAFFNWDTEFSYANFGPGVGLPSITSVFVPQNEIMAYVALSNNAGGGGFASVNLNAPIGYPTLGTRDTASGDNSKIYVTNDKIYALNTARDAITVADKSNFSTQGTAASGAGNIVSFIANSAGWLFVARNNASNSEIEIWDVRDISQISKVTLPEALTTNGIANDMGVSESMNALIIADGFSGVMIIDIENPEIPIIAESFFPVSDSETTGVDVIGDMIYISNYDYSTPFSIYQMARNN